MKFNNIEEKYKDLINIAKEYMYTIMNMILIT